MEPLDAKRFFEMSLDLCCIANLEGRFLLVNPRFTELLGYDEKTLTSQPFLFFVHPDDVEHTVQEMERLNRGEETLNFRNRYRTCEGEYRWLAWNARVVMEEGRIYAIARDVTELEAERENSRIHSLWLKRAEKMSGVGHWRVNLSTMDVFWSDEIFTIHGLDPAVGAPDIQSAVEAYHPEDRQKVQEHVNHTIETGEPFEFQMRIVRPCGDERLVWSRGERLEDSQGRPTAIFGVFMDMTERDTLRRALEETESRFESLYNSTPALLHSIDSEGRLVEVSDYWLDQMGYSRKEVLGRRSTEFLDSKSQKRAEEAIKTFMDQGYVEDIPYRFIKKDGSSIDVLLSAIAEYDENGSFSRSLAVSANVTARKLAERRLEASHAELRELAIAASHDLKAPIRNVKVFTDLALEKCAAADVKEYLTFVKTAGYRLEAVAQAMTELMRLEGIPSNFQEVDLNELLLEVESGLASTFLEHQGALTWEELPTVQADRTQLYCLLENLLSNSLKFRSKEPPEIHICAESRDGRNELVIQDNGMGIPSEHRESVFTLFKRLHRQDEIEGTGAGLAVVRKVAEAHGGEVRFESCDRGAKVRVSLPISPQRN